MDYKGKARAIINELNEVFKKLDISSVEDLVAQILKSKKVILVGVGREGLATQAFAMRLMHLGLESHWIWDVTTPAIEKEDLLIATSGCGKIGHIHYVVETAIQHGAKTAVITGDPKQKTPSIADIVLFLPATVYLGTADVVPSEQPMGNLFEQSLLILFDMIVMDLQEKLGKTRGEMESRHRNLE